MKSALKYRVIHLKLQTKTLLNQYLKCKILHKNLPIQRNLLVIVIAYLCTVIVVSVQALIQGICLLADIKVVAGSADIRNHWS